MRSALRLLLITAAVSITGGAAAALSGCASKPRALEPPSSTTTPRTEQGDPQRKTELGAGHQGGSVASAGSTSASVAGPAGAGPSPKADGSSAGLLGATGAAGPGAPAGSPAAPGSAAPLTGAQTPEERRAAIDKRLNDSLGSFDAKLRSEQQKVAMERDGRQTAVATIAASDSSSSAPGNAGVDGNNGGNDSSAAATGTGTGAGNGSHRRGNVRSERPGDLKSDRTADGLKPDPGNGASAAGNGAVANEVPDGNDDDVVARRLRKAAEQETDPELKEKLWREYVEYKKNAQGK